MPTIEHWVTEHQSMVYSLALRFLGNRAGAEELSQDVFLEMHRNHHLIQSDDHARHWLRQVTCRRAIDLIRRNRLRRGPSLDAIVEPSIQPTTPDPLLRNELDRWLLGLPAKHRSVVVLRYQEDLDPAEIADTLSIPVATVRSILHRALGVIRRRLAQPVRVKPIQRVQPIRTAIQEAL
jgi:RNA polymerase sigma-70 factor (ECF subfamily)